jgi:hypothetical protein
MVLQELFWIGEKTSKGPVDLDELKEVIFELLK